jgi:hypothetical protein
MPKLVQGNSDQRGRAVGYSGLNQACLLAPQDRLTHFSSIAEVTRQAISPNSKSEVQTGMKRFDEVEIAPARCYQDCCEAFEWVPHTNLSDTEPCNDESRAMSIHDEPLDEKTIEKLRREVDEHTTVPAIPPHSRSHLFSRVWFVVIGNSTIWVFSGRFSPCNGRCLGSHFFVHSDSCG